MRTYNSPKIEIQNTQAILDFLALPSNFKLLMPDSIQKFNATADSFSFQLSGMPTIHLKKVESEDGFFYENQGGSVSFGLYFPIEGNTLTFEVKGSINGMVHMMLSKPLTNLLTIFSEKIIQQGL